MRTLIELYFQPGAAGNFFSRCLNLLDNAYCYASGTTIPVTIEEKFKLLSESDYSLHDSALASDCYFLNESFYIISLVSSKYFY